MYLQGPVVCATGRGSLNVTPQLTLHIVIQVGAVVYWRHVSTEITRRYKVTRSLDVEHVP